MMRLVAHVVLAILLLPALSWAQWTNEPAGSVVVVDCNFSSAPSACGLLDVYGTSFRDSDGSAPTSPPGVFRSTLSANTINGGSQIEWNAGTTYNEIYIGKQLRTNAAFQGWVCCANKMFFPRGPGTNGFFGMAMSSPTASSGNLYFGPNTGGLDNSHTCGGSGFTCSPNINSISFAKGSWTLIEAYLRKSTTGTSRDGIVRWWINGTLAGDYTDLNYPGGFNNWVWTETYGGQTDPTVPVDRSFYIDHMRISIPNCPLGCPGGGTTPPPQPSPQPLPPSSGNYVYQSQYSGTQGSSQWSYRDTAGNLLTYNSGTNLWNGIQSYQGVWSSGFHPGTTNGTVVRWTAPENGTATIAGSAQKGDLSGGDGVTFEVKYGATVLYTKAIGGTDGTSYPYSVSQAMTTGQTIDFIVTPGANNTYDSTMLNPTIAWAPTSGSAPTISSFSPTSGAVGTSVVITGTNFVPSLSGNAVSFSDIAATVTAATATSITATVPPAALTGTIKVTTTLGTGTSGSNFTVPLAGAVEDVRDVTASALSTSSVQVRFTALSDGAGAAAKHAVRIAQGVISWGTASDVASGTCSTPYAPGVINTVTTCTITGLTTGTQYDVQLVPYKGTIGVDAVYGNLSNIATVTTMGTIIDVPVICQVTDDLVLVADGCPKSKSLDQVSLLHD